MSNLIKLSKAPNFFYDWTQIVDLEVRARSKSSSEAYAAAFTKRREQAESLVSEDNAHRARVVHQLKMDLPHGQFQDVCAQFYNINERTASALAANGKLLMDGNYQEEVHQMLKVMEPQAANRFLKAEPEVKSAHVCRFQKDNHVPSRRDFQPKKTKPAEPVSAPAVSVPKVVNQKATVIKLNSSLQEIKGFTLPMCDEVRTLILELYKQL